MSASLVGSEMCIRDRFSFFKQKTAYEMSASLVGSEMCIRDRHYVSYYPDTATTEIYTRKIVGSVRCV
ncbi:hypothetical protein JMUB7550_27500 [Staphylococcus aureus]